MGRLTVLLRVVCFVSCFIVVAVPARAELLFSAPPRESAEEAAHIYGPLAELLSKRTGEHVVYTHAINWIEYSSNMRKGAYDIVFDGPHFAAWRMKHLRHAPTVKLPGSLVFLIVVRADDKATKLADLKSSSICALAPPNLGAMSALARFANPVIQPTLVEVLGHDEIMGALMANKCRAAVLPERLFKKMDDSERKKIKVMYTSPAYPDQTITVSPRVSESTREVIVMTLAEPRGVPEASRLLSTYTKKATHFEVANSEEFDGLEQLLEGEIWGW